MGRATGTMHINSNRKEESKRNEVPVKKGFSELPALLCVWLGCQMLHMVSIAA